MITVDLLMSTHPCENWPRSRVERLVPKMDCSSWTAFAASAKASRWRRVSVDDLTLTACRYAAAHHRADVLVPWVQHVIEQTGWRTACTAMVGTGSVTKL